MGMEIHGKQQVKVVAKDIGYMWMLSLMLLRRLKSGQDWTMAVIIPGKRL
jgi:hypothetical protein